MADSTFSLTDILGWKPQSPLTSTLLVVNDNISGNSDAITTAFISHCISTGGSVCLVGASNTASHYAQTCKKHGVALDRARRSGLYYHIDSLLSTVTSTPAPSATPKDSNTFPTFSIEVLADRIGRAYAHWQSLRASSLISDVATCTTSSTTSSSNSTTFTSSSSITDNMPIPRFNVVLDDVEALADVYVGGSVSAMLDLINYLVEIVSTPKCDISEVISAIDVTTGQTRRLATTANTGADGVAPRGTVLVICSPDAPDGVESGHSAGLASMPTQSPALDLPLLPTPSIPRPSMSATATASSVKTSAQEALFDTVIRRSSPIGSMLLHHPNAEMCIEIASLPSGYSTDVQAQLTIHRFGQIPLTRTNDKGKVAQYFKGTVRPSQIVFLSISSDGSLRCHTRG